MKTGILLTKPKPGFERAAGIKSGGLFGADRQIIDHQFRGRVFQFVDDLFASGFFLQWKERAERILIVHVRSDSRPEHSPFSRWRR